jgi:hypothetical protein
MADCVNASLVHAISIWFSGAKLDGYCIHGLSVVWIGRLAKVLIFLASIPIILDILGEARVERASSELGRDLDDFRRWVVKTFLSLVGEEPYQLGWTQFFVSFAICVPLLIGYFGLITFPARGFLWILGGKIDPPIGAIDVILYIAAAAVLLTWPLISLCETFLITAASILRKKRLCRYIRASAALTLLLGFFLDMFVAS